MDNVQKYIARISILFVVLQSAFTVSAAENQYFDPAETQLFKELPTQSEVKPPLPPGGITQQHRVTVQKSSQMRSPGARKNIPNTLEKLQKLGYLEVSDADIAFLSIESVKGQFISIEDVVHNISSPLSIMPTNTGIFKTMTLAGSIASGAEIDTGKWTHVIRYYSLANGEVLTLSEADFKAAKYSIVVPEELWSEEVKGLPASVVTSKTTSGIFFTELSWFTDNKFYTLRLTGHGIGNGVRSQLKELATGILEPEAQ